MTTYLDSSLYMGMLREGAASLSRNKNTINDLNVFETVGDVVYYLDSLPKK